MRYVLGESSARFLRELMAKERGYKPAQPLRPREVKRDFAASATGSPRYHLRYSTSKTTEGGVTTITASIGEGAVQIGGYTYFTAGDEIANMGDGTQYVCAVVELAGAAVSFAAYASTAAINQAQSDMTKYIFPLYKVVDYAVQIDYRPMPNAGCWEIAESVSNGGSGSGGSGSGGAA